MVKNLKPIALRGIESHGMLLCASDETDTALELLNVEKWHPEILFVNEKAKTFKRSLSCFHCTGNGDGSFACRAVVLEPANLISIGLTGLSQILNRSFSMIGMTIPVGVFTLVLNVPLCIYGAKTVSPRFVLFSILSVLVQSFWLLDWDF